MLDLAPTTTPLPGFNSPVIQSQQVFRAALDAFAHPGRIVEVSELNDVPSPLLPASAALCLALVDFETPIWLDGRARASDSAVAYLRFHCGCPLVDDPTEAKFALVTAPASRPALDGFQLGTDTHPEDAATVILQVTDLDANGPTTLKGPGIEHSATLGVSGLDAGFWPERIVLRELFPRGVDLVFAAADRIAAVPRSTLVEI